jgi:serine/threonine-protein phosphatase 2B catalytic subunit
VGDIHGQFFDMIHMFEKVVDVRAHCKMLFLGDYVDRGIYSIEVLIFLFCLKLNNPKNIVMLRGNHESRAMTEHFTFRHDVQKKYGDESLYDMFLECFQSMPLCATVNKEYICMHGGISP